MSKDSEPLATTVKEAKRALAAKRLLLRLLGDTLREIGLLFVVFAPLDVLLGTHPGKNLEMFGFLIVGVACIKMGISLQMRGELEQ